MRTSSASSRRNRGLPVPLSTGPDKTCARWTVLLIMPTGVCSETEEAGDINSEYEGLGVSGVVGCVRYAFAGFVGEGVFILVEMLDKGRMMELDSYLSGG
jgi:hypothetical protein